VGSGFKKNVNTHFVVPQRFSLSPLSLIFVLLAVLLFFFWEAISRGLGLVEKGGTNT
jgi:hypothetical protein